MWIALRLILAVVAFVIQVRRRSLKTLNASDRKGKSPPFFVKTHGSDKKITAITLGMRSPSSAWVQLSRERWTDRLAKALGLASELQTGDASFDYKIYVACDHPRAEQMEWTPRERRSPRVSSRKPSLYSRAVLPR